MRAAAQPLAFRLRRTISRTGLPGLAANATGWLNRLLTALPAGAPIKSKGAIQIGEAPLILRGPAPVLGWSPTWFNHVDGSDALSRCARSTARATRAPRRCSTGASRPTGWPSAAAPMTATSAQLRKGFRGAGRLVAAADGPRIAVLSVGGFDTHATRAARPASSPMCSGELDQGIQDFKTTVGAAWSQTVVVHGDRVRPHRYASTATKAPITASPRWRCLPGAR